MKMVIAIGLSILCATAIVASNSIPGRLPHVPASANRLKNPYMGRRSAVKAGAALYSSKCSSCHGDDARGFGSAVNLRTSKTHATTDGSLFWFITHGDPDGGMPSFTDLSDKERWQIVTYVKSLSLAGDNK